MTCEKAIATLMPCKPYLTTSEPSPTLACCQAVASVNASGSTTQSRRDLCECFQKNAHAYGVIADKAKQLPGLCGVLVPVPIYPSVDCHKASFKNSSVAFLPQDIDAGVPSNFKDSG
ncbi:putative Nonspecific lipid-transfer protein [Hibiscus syriacus]|uniref:Nonspecific lipid-transfer protein n=1 Tax=Hibiscus syriacus TaxID=106335 RepID=A0A6A3AIZ3_HIBSY|nr:putative Nonspecific lipid-transfer protein [Hibiscus syriacus]